MVNVKDVGLEFDHLGIYINDDESDTEEEFFNGQVKYFIDQFKERDDISIPVMPYPRMNVCMGLEPNSPSVEIEDGFVRVGFRFDISQAEIDCLFE